MKREDTIVTDDQIKIPTDEQYKRAMAVVRLAERQPMPGWLNQNVRAAVALIVNADFIRGD